MVDISTVLASGIISIITSIIIPIILDRLGWIVNKKESLQNLKKCCPEILITRKKYPYDDDSEKTFYYKWIVTEPCYGEKSEVLAKETQFPDDDTDNYIFLNIKNRSEYGIVVNSWTLCDGQSVKTIPIPLCPKNMLCLFYKRGETPVKSISLSLFGYEITYLIDSADTGFVLPKSIKYMKNKH